MFLAQNHRTQDKPCSLKFIMARYCDGSTNFLMIKHHNFNLQQWAAQSQEALELLGIVALAERRIQGKETCPKHVDPAGANDDV